MEKETPTPSNRAVLNKNHVTVRVVKQAVRHDGRTYHGPRQGEKGPMPGETFKVSPERLEALGPLVQRVDETAAA